MHGSPPKRREKKARRLAAGRPSPRFEPPRRSWGHTHCVRSRLRREFYHPQRSSETLRLACKIAPICLIPYNQNFRTFAEVERDRISQRTKEVLWPRQGPRAGGSAAPKARWASPSLTAGRKKSAYSYKRRFPRPPLPRDCASPGSPCITLLTHGRSIPTLHNRSLEPIVLERIFLQESGRYPIENDPEERHGIVQAVQRQRVVSAMADRFDRCVGVRRGRETCSIAVNDFDRIQPGRRVC